MGLSVSVPAASVVIRDDVSPALCERYVDAHPSASTYHRPEWLGVIARAFGHDTKWLSAHRGNDIVGILPLVFFRSRLFGRFAVSLPFVNYGGVVGDTPAIEAALVDHAVEETRRAGGSHLELRHRRQHLPTLAARRHKVAMLLDLQRTQDLQWQQLDRKLRNQVRKAERYNFDVRVGGIELLDSFYTVFARNMRDLGTPVYGLTFFREVIATFPKHSRVFVATFEGRPAAASIVHWYHDTIEVPWASAIREFNPLCVNVLLYWHMLRFATERGFRRFDFGRSTRDGGTFLFKRQWGAKPQELVWEYWTAEGRPIPEINPQNPRFAKSIEIWQRLPVSIATAVGPFIVRNIP